MKNPLLSMLVVLSVFQGFSQKESITLTFYAKDSLTQNLLALDSVNIKNLTENCDTTLYDAVSVLTLEATWPVGFEEQTSTTAESFLVMQNVPNPFEESTLVKIYLKNDGELNLAVYDDQGKNPSQYHNIFKKGWHMFGVSTNGSQLLFLKVSDNTTTKTIKLLSTGFGNERARVFYKGQTGQGSSLLKSFPATTGFIFYLGNQLSYTAYVEGYHQSIISDNPVSSENYTFAMLPISIQTIPTVSTSSMTNITPYTATSGGNVTIDGGATVTARGVCWSTSQNPTLGNSYTIDGTGIGPFISTITGLTKNTLYYVRAYATNSVGTAYGNEESFTTSLTFAIGDNYGGGVIFYLDGTGLNGLISSTSDQSTGGIPWGCPGITIGTSTPIGTGQVNTWSIVNGCSERPIAASICDGLVLNGYDDWFLPSKDEMDQMYLQRSVIGNFTSQAYWTSSEYIGSQVYLQDFSSGSTTWVSKEATWPYIRAIRAFSTSFTIGQSYRGGIIFYIDGTGQHGLISATSDQSTGAPWGCGGTTIGGTSTAIGTGQANTTAIVNVCTTAGIAASICNDLMLNGYDDWFLPSLDELNQMYLQRNVIGGFATLYYWSSSEYGSDYAWYQNFANGNQYYGAGKYGAFYVRAVRAF